MSHVTHPNAPLAPAGRRNLVELVLEEGWAQARVAERLKVSRATVAKWVRRYRAQGLDGLADYSSRPHHSPRRVLSRYRMPLLGHVEQNTGLPIRRPAPVRYERENPGDLDHVDVRKLGRIPDGGGHRTLGRQAGKRNRRSGVGHSFLHSAIDDHSRLVYSEILTDEKKETAAGFWVRANAFYASHGITVLRVMSDNGSCYRSHVFADALGSIPHKFIRPYRPQTNGKIECFHRTLATEWAYARHYNSDDARAATYQDWIHSYNHHRPHTGIGGRSPIDRVNNVTGKNT